jgi:hypothetical protein
MIPQVKYDDILDRYGRIWNRWIQVSNLFVYGFCHFSISTFFCTYVENYPIYYVRSRNMETYNSCEIFIKMVKLDFRPCIVARIGFLGSCR